jgi:hypothetical protein
MIGIVLMLSSAVAILAGIEPATHGVEIRYSTECGVGQIASWMFHNIR